MEEQGKIKSLKYPESVRRMPHMMLGDLNDSSILIREIFDNSRDELIASKNCDTIYMYNDSDIHIVIDNGRGIPLLQSDEDPEITQMELAVANIFAGGKYESTTEQGGMHGVGSSAVNAVSNFFMIACRVREDHIGNSNSIVNNFFKDNQFEDEKYFLIITFEKGYKQTEYVGTIDDIRTELKREVPEKMSTYVGFIPDDTIVKSCKAPISESWYRYTFEVMKSFYNKEINIIINDKVIENQYKEYKYKIIKELPLKFPGINDKLKVILNWEFDEDLSVKDYSGSVNMISVPYGLHIHIGKWAITNALKEFFSIKHNHIEEGLKLDVILLAKKVGYNTQTKENLVKIDSLSNDDWYGFNEEIHKMIKDHYDEFQNHVNKLNAYNDSLQDLKAIDLIKSSITIASEGNTNRTKSYLPSKLKDCSSSDRLDCELMIVEGESAGGSIMSVRDPRTQAVIGLRGKILNTTERSLESAFESEEVRNIISAIGMGVDAYYDTSNPRYGKIIIACDPDCFTGDTEVRLVNGTIKTLKELYDSNATNFEVFSKDIKNNKVVPGLAKKAIKGKTHRRMIELTFENDEVVVCTPDHKFLMSDLTYKDADSLIIDDKVLSIDDNTYLGESSMIIKDINVLYGEFDTYCLEVEEYHNFALASGPFVHNCDGYHIAGLLLSLFSYHMSFLIEKGFVYLLETPLFIQDSKFFYADQEDQVDKSKFFDRFKGLGSFENEEDKRRFLTDRSTRRLIKITPEGINDAIQMASNSHFRKHQMKLRNLIK